MHHDDLTELVLNVDADRDGVPDRLVTTEDHPFWNATEGAWEGPEEFTAGDEVVDEQWNRIEVTGLDPGTTRRDLAYNLTVEGIHTYHLGAADVLVHNTGDSCGTVYRVIRSDEDVTAGLSAKNPDASYSVAAHVRSGSRLDTQFIWTTRDLAVAEKWAAKTGNRIVEIDLLLVESPIVDLSTAVGRESHLPGHVIAQNFANASREVLVAGPIPASAVRLR